MQRGFTMLLVFAVLFSFHGCVSWGNNVKRADKKEITVDGIKIIYEDYGQGDVILFVHGFGASSYSWRRVAISLANQGWRCICLDLMGFGDSDKPRDESYTLKRQAELIRQFVTALEIPRLHLAGHSYGGGVCLALFTELMKLDRPALTVQSLTLADCVCYPQKFPSFIKALRTPVINWILLNLVPARTSAKSILNLCYYSPEKIADETVDEYARGLNMPGGHQAVVKTARNIIPEYMGQLLESYGKIEIPVLIMWGEHDKIISLDLGRRLAKEISTASLKIFKTCGHVPQEEYPDETAVTMHSFLTPLK